MSVHRARLDTTLVLVRLSLPGFAQRSATVEAGASTSTETGSSWDGADQVWSGAGVWLGLAGECFLFSIAVENGEPLLDHVMAGASRLPFMGICNLSITPFGE